MVEGLDVYGRYNKVTNWTQVNGAKDFVWIKVSDGTGLHNAVGASYDYGYVGDARAAGLSTGGYHYAQFGDPVAQANLFIDRCETLGCVQIAPMLDLESPFVANQDAINFAIAFCRRVIERGHKPALYANNSMLSVIRGPFKAAVPNSYVVVARYGANPTVVWDNWQFTSSGSCPGVVGNVDLDTGIFPANDGGSGGNMALDNDDKNWLVNALGHSAGGMAGGNGVNDLHGWWYFDRFEGNANFAQVFFGMRDTVRAIAASISQLKDVVVASEANDVTADALANALVPLVVTQLVDGLTHAVGNLPNVNLSQEQITDIANATASTISARLAGPATA
jgi:GH25 family lysozyme M1 (1,4-beta-N-acetylmuramidase)